jgi:hypothetical protein
MKAWNEERTEEEETEEKDVEEELIKRGKESKEGSGSTSTWFHSHIVL